MPVHRVPGGKRGYVLAYTSELDAWLRAMKLQDPDDGRGSSASDLNPGQALRSSEGRFAAGAEAPAQVSNLVPLKIDMTGHWKLFWGAAGVALLLCGGIGFRSLSGRNTGNSTIASRHIPVPGAEEAYLRGRYFWNLRTADSLTKAIDAFTQAIVKDPSYAEAYAGLAECYDLLPEFGRGELNESLLQAEDAANRAIALDPNLASAHRAKAFALYFRDWDIAGSDTEFRRALALDPNSAETHQWYASSLQCRDEGAEALKQIDEARRLDPASPAIAVEQAYFQADFGDLGAGIRALKEIEKTQPNLSSPASNLAVIEFAMGDYPDYVADTRRYALITGNPDDLALADAVARGWARGGKAGLIEARAKALKTAYDHGSEAGFWLGETLVMLGRPKEALPYFKACLNVHMIVVSMMIQDCPWAKALSADPDYVVFFAEVRSRQHGGYPHSPPLVHVALQLPN